MSSENDPGNPYRYSAPETLQDYAVDPRLPASLDFPRRKRRQLVLLLVGMAVLGFVSGLLSEDSAMSRMLDVARELFFSVLVLAWCNIDREERDVSCWRFFVPMMVLCPGPIILLPTYLFVTRGLGGFAATAKAITFFILMIFVSVVTCSLALLLTGGEW